MLSSRSDLTDSFDALINIDESEKRGSRIAAALSRLSPKNALDLGCSSGFMVKALRDISIDAVGIDSSGDRFLEGIRQFLFIVDAGVQPFPFSDGSFDLVTALTSIDYVSDYSHALDEVARTLRDDGYFVMTFGLDPRMRSGSRPNIHPDEWWARELSRRGFSADAKLAQDYEWEVGLRHQISGTPMRFVPPTLVRRYKRFRGKSQIGCIVARLNSPRQYNTLA